MNKSKIIVSLALAFTAISLISCDILDEKIIVEGTTIKTGDFCTAKDVEVYGSDEPFNISNYKDKVVIINFWATWSLPAITGIQYLNEVQEMYMDDVVIIAIGSAGDKDDEISNYLENESRSWKDYSIKFGFDEEGNDYYSILGFSGSWPLTLVIDQEGKINETYNSVVSKTELLDSIEELLK